MSKNDSTVSDIFKVHGRDTRVTLTTCCRFHCSEHRDTVTVLREFFVCEPTAGHDLAEICYTSHTRKAQSSVHGPHAAVNFHVMPHDMGTGNTGKASILITTVTSRQPPPPLTQDKTSALESNKDYFTKVKMIFKMIVIS